MKQIEIKQIEFNNIKKVLGLDIEREDREVGIFGNFFSLVFETDDKKNVCIGLEDNEFNTLIDIMKPYVLEQIQQEEIEKEQYEDYMKNENTTN